MITTMGIRKFSLLSSKKRYKCSINVLYNEYKLCALNHYIYLSTGTQLHVLLWCERKVYFILFK